MTSTSEIYDILMKQYGDYEDGTELGDAIGSLVQGAHVLAGINMYPMAVQIMMHVRELIYGDLEWTVREEGIGALTDKQRKLWNIGC